jgi:hypothetical protein
MSFEEKNLAAEPAGPETAAAPEDALAPRGRPFAMGQSGNPRGRPSRFHQAAWVAQHKIDRYTIPLVDDALMRARGDNTAMLRACLERLVPPRREAPVWLKVPPIEDRAGAKAALKAVATGVAQGDIPPAQGLKLVRIYTELMRWL